MEYPETEKIKHLEKAYVLAALEGAILLSYLVIVSYLKCKKRIETDLK